MIKLMLDENLSIYRHAGWGNVRETVDSKKSVYLDIVAPDEDDIEGLRSIFHFHPTNLDDCTFFSENPKLEEHRSYIFTVVHSLIFNEKKSSYESHDVHIFLGEGYIISVHDIELGIFHEILTKATGNDEKKKLDCDYLYYTILDSIVDSCFPALAYWSDKIDEAEEYIFDTASADGIVNRVIEIRKGVLALKRIIMPQREIIYKISHTDVDYIGEDTRIYLRDVFDHIAKAYNSVEDYRDMLSNLMDAHFSKASASMNEVMKRLTVISTVFMPLTFIVGVYGMNFRNMPELEWRYGYFFILLIMIVAAVGLLKYFRRKKWY